MASSIFGRLRYGVIAAAMIMAGCQTPSLSVPPLSPAEAVKAMTGKLDLATRARRSAEYHASRGDWRSARIAVTEARFAAAEAEEIRVVAANMLTHARRAHRRAMDEMTAARLDPGPDPDRGPTRVASASGGVPGGSVGADEAEADRSTNGASARLVIARTFVVATARVEERSEKALIEIDRLLSDIRRTADQTRRAGRSGGLTRSWPSIQAPDSR
jgi:hypothetical protein